MVGFNFFVTSVQGGVIKGPGLGSSEKTVCVKKLQDSERLSTTPREPREAYLTSSGNFLRTLFKCPLNLNIVDGPQR